MIIGPPTVQQRKAILTVLCARMPVCPSVDMAELAQQTTGYVGADLSALCREAAMNAIRENSKVNTHLKKMKKKLRKALGPPQFARRTITKSLLCSSSSFYMKKSKFMCHKCLVILQGLGEQTIGMKHFQQALKSVLPSCLRSSLGRTELSPVSWQQIGGLDEVKIKLRQVRCKVKTLL